MSWLKNLSIVVMCVVTQIVTSNATILNVPEEFSTIALAMEEANAGDTILVAPGVYRSSVSITEFGFVLASHYIFSNYPKHISETVLEGGNHERSVVSVYNLNEEVVEINGFTIRNGRTDYGGGVYSRNSRVLLQNLIIEDNIVAANGGGVYSTTNSEVILKNVVLRNNSANNFGGGFAGFETNETQFDNVQFINNRSYSSSFGGSASAFHSSADAVFSNCSFEQNGSGALGAKNSGEISLTDCIIRYNRGGKLLHFESSELRLFRTLIVDNSEIEMVIYLNSVSNFTMDNVTIADNLGNPLPIVHANHGYITNSIIQSSVEGAPRASYLGDDFQVSYTNFQGGFERNGGEWLEGNIDVDPLFLDRENGDYRLRAESPCIDAGDPDVEFDVDESRRDMGAISRLPAIQLSGIVTNALNDEPIEGVRISTSLNDVTFTDENGYYIIDEDIYRTQWIDVSYPDFYDIRNTELGLQFGEAIEIDFALTTPIVEFLQEEIATEAEFGDEVSQVLTIRNAGSAEYAWSSEIVHTGALAFEPLDLNEVMPLAQQRGLARINGFTIVDGLYYLTTSNNVSGNWIYVVTPEGEFVYVFEQPRVDGHYRMHQLTWDGELLWGGVGNTMFGMTLDGDVVERFDVNFNASIYNVVWDARNDCFWISGLTTDILSYDRAGLNLRTIDRQGFRVYGFAIHPDDTRDQSLIVLTHNTSSRTDQVYQIDPTSLVPQFELLHDLGTPNIYLGLFITSSLVETNYQIVTINTAEQYDIHRLQLAPRFDWLEMETTEGVVAPLSEQEVILNMKAFTSDSMGAIFTAEITIFNDFRGEKVIPISLEMTDLSIDFEPIISDFELLSAYPNPFNAVTRLHYSLPNASRITLKVYDVRGRLVANLFDGERPAGVHSLMWDAAGLSTGLYFVRAETAGGLNSVQKVMLLK